MKLTDVVVRNLPTPPVGFKIYSDDTPKGFGVRVTAGGVKAFVLTHGRSRQRVTIGRYPVIGLADARTEAKRILAEQTLGKRQAPRQSFEQAIDAFLASHEANNRPGTSSEVRRILKKQFASLHRHQLADITTHNITRITDKMVSQGHPSAANHAYMAARAFLNWCVRRRYISHSPLQGLEKPAPTPSRERVLSDDELKAVWIAAEEVGGTYGRIVQLLALTGQRRGEISGLKGEWIAEDAITLPASICKNRRPHTFPIGALAASIVQPISFNGWSKAKTQLDNKIAIARGSKKAPKAISPWTLHDLRRTYATNLQRLGIKLEVIEALLNHVSGTRAGIVGVYQRHAYEAEMREAVNVYEKWLQVTIISE